MVELPVDFVSLSVIDVQVVAGATGSTPDRWAVDGIVLDEEVLVVTGLLNLSRAPKRYRIGGVAVFRSRETPVVALDQQELADFIRGSAAHLVYSHLRGHLNTLAGIVGETHRFPATAPLAPELLRSSGRWQLRSADDAGGDGLVL